MAYLIAILVSVLLLIGFVSLTILEARRGTRVLSGVRNTLDRKVAGVEHFIETTDFRAFIRHHVRSIGTIIAHDVAQVILTAVRSLEEVLTDIVRRLRHHAPATRPGPMTAYVRRTLHIKPEQSAPVVATEEQKEDTVG